MTQQAFPSHDRKLAIIFRAVTHLHTATQEMIKHEAKKTRAFNALYATAAFLIASISLYHLNVVSSILAAVMGVFAFIVFALSWVGQFDTEYYRQMGAATNTANEATNFGIDIPHFSPH